MRVLLNPGTRNRLPELTEAVARQEAERHLGSTGNLEYRLLALGFNRPRTPSSNTRSRPPFDLEEKDEGGNTGAALAVSGEKAGLFDLYHRAGANLDTTNWAGDGLLHLAAGRGNLDLLEKLLAAGIQRKVNKNGQMPGDILWRTGDNFGDLRLIFRAPTLQRLADFMGCGAEDAARTFKLECKQNEQFSRPSGQFTLSIEGRRLNLLQRLKAAIGGRSGQAPQLEQKTVGDRAIATLAGSRDGYAVKIRATGPLLLSDEVRSLRDWGLADAFHPKDAPGTTSPQVKTLRVALLLGLLGMLFFILNLVRSRRS